MLRNWSLWIVASYSIFTLLRCIVSVFVCIKFHDQAQNDAIIDYCYRQWSIWRFILMEATTWTYKEALRKEMDTL